MMVAGSAAPAPLSEVDLGDYQVGHLLVPALGDAVEGQAETLGLAGAEVAGLPAGYSHALTQHYLAIGVSEDAVDLHQLHDALALVADLAIDLEYRLLQITLVGLHLDFTQLEILK